MKSKAPPPNKAERERITRMKAEIGCICCILSLGIRSRCDEVHHIISGNKRMGHWYTLPLCRQHHQGGEAGIQWTSVAQGSKAFTRAHGTQIDLWLKIQHMLNLPDDLPPSKIFKRATLSEAPVNAE